ncbi:MAG: hypothetical protein CMJ81_15440 [Planctomycetaceae bacterium]|nr:hypothetical protein [Planctomycetaceae bacterium]
MSLKVNLDEGTILVKGTALFSNPTVIMMIFPLRRLFLPAAIAAGIGGPFLIQQGGLKSISQKVGTVWHSDTAAVEPEPSSRLDDIRRHVSPSHLETTSNHPITGQPVTELGEIFRFNVTPEWVMYRWPRVTTQLADLELNGLRVPLVTGTNKYDLAGSLTYYFDKKQQLQRISFRGFTDDESKLVELVTKHCGLRPVSTLARGLYLVKWNGKPRSALRICTASIVRADSPYTRLDVELELNRPGPGYRLSKAFEQSLEEDLSQSTW